MQGLLPHFMEGLELDADTAPAFVAGADAGDAGALVAPWEGE